MKLLHFGFKVRDLDATVAAYRDLFGIAFDPVREHVLPGAARVLVTHGHTDDGVEIEMVQPLGGRTTDDLVLDGREGISHVAFEVEDLAAERARLASLGLEIVNEGSAPRADWFFVADPRLGGALVQLVALRNPR